MDLVEFESVGVICPAFTNEFVWRQTLEGLQSAGVIVGVYEVVQVLFQLVVIVVMIAFNRCLLDRAVHAFDLTIGPGVFDFCQSMINAVLRTDTVKNMNAGKFVTSLVGELNAVVRQDCVDRIRQRLDQIAQERRRRHFSGFLHQLDKGELRCPVNGDKQVQLALLGAHFGDVDMKIADGVSLEFLFARFVSSHLWQTRYPVALKAAMQR